MTYLQKNFHYIFNLRDLSNVFAGMLFSTNVRNSPCCQKQTKWHRFNFGKQIILLELLLYGLETFLSFNFRSRNQKIAVSKTKANMYAIHTLFAHLVPNHNLIQDCVKTPEDLTRLWVHETSRVSWRSQSMPYILVVVRCTGISSLIPKIWMHLTKRRRTSWRRSLRKQMNLR